MQKNGLKSDHQTDTKPVGARINIGLWDKVKIQAIREGRKTGEILDDAIRLYLESISSDEV